MRISLVFLIALLALCVFTQQADALDNPFKGKDKPTRPPPKPKGGKGGKPPKIPGLDANLKNKMKGKDVAREKGDKFKDKMDRFLKQAIKSGEFSDDEISDLKDEVREHGARRMELNNLRKANAQERGEDAEAIKDDIKRQMSELNKEHDEFLARHRDRIKPKRPEGGFPGKPGKDDLSPEERKAKAMEKRRAVSKKRIEDLYSEAEKSGNFDAEELATLREELDEWLSDEGDMMESGTVGFPPSGGKDGRPKRPDEMTDDEKAKLAEDKEAWKGLMDRRKNLEKRIKGEL